MKMTVIRRRYELKDEEWERIQKYFPERKATVNGILWIARSGAPWRDLPERYGAWNSVYKCFAKWEENHIFDMVFQELSIDADMQDLSLDSTSCKAHQHSAGAKKGL